MAALLKCPVSIRPEFIIIYVPRFGHQLSSLPPARCDEYSLANVLVAVELIINAATSAQVVMKALGSSSSEALYPFAG